MTKVFDYKNGGSLLEVDLAKDTYKYTTLCSSDSGVHKTKHIDITTFAPPRNAPQRDFTKQQDIDAN